MSVRFKRLLAFLMDWNITLFPFVVLAYALAALLRRQSEINPIVIFGAFLTVILAFGIFILRDVIFNGRSIGKRIFNLYVYEKSSLKPASVKQRFLRNVFLFLYVIDGIILLVSGDTIGDRVAGTVVLSKQELESGNKDIQCDSAALKKKNLKTAILIFAILVCGLVAFIGVIQAILNSQKSREEYKVAYSYFIKSEAFKKLNVDKSKIRFNKYSLNTYTAENGEPAVQTVKIGFVVNFKSFEVICHKENDIWRVCDECTLFD